MAPFLITHCRAPGAACDTMGCRNDGAFPIPSAPGPWHSAHSRSYNFAPAFCALRIAGKRILLREPCSGGLPRQVGLGRPRRTGQTGKQNQGSHGVPPARNKLRALRLICATSYDTPTRSRKPVLASVSPNPGDRVNMVPLARVHANTGAM